jgi:hypothetical protein
MSAMCGVASCACFGRFTGYSHYSDTPHGSVSLVSDVLELLALAIFPVFSFLFVFVRGSFVWVHCDAFSLYSSDPVLFGVCERFVECFCSFPFSFGLLQLE